MIKKILITASILFSLVSCEKEALYGPEGDAGAIGGDGGIGGDYEFYSEEFLIVSSDWVKKPQTDHEYEHTVDVPILTQDAIDRSMVLVYWIDDSTLTSTILPFDDVDKSFRRRMHFVIQERAVIIRVEDTDFYQQPLDRKYRIVVIESEE